MIIASLVLLFLLFFLAMNSMWAHFDRIEEKLDRLTSQLYGDNWNEMDGGE